MEGHKTFVPQVIDELKKLGRDDIMVIARGVITNAAKHRIIQSYLFLP
jgi:methylmalonyl-CoA mutase cobalamin-binding domain/chain